MCSDMTGNTAVRINNSKSLPSERSLIHLEIQCGVLLYLVDRRQGFSLKELNFLQKAYTFFLKSRKRREENPALVV